MTGLATYRSKRDFGRTSEPRGKRARRRGFSFVVQKHAARRLHYDFRLELDGVLLSWAVPKGPSLDPRVKRLAVQTEDHPVEYGGFEGIIPDGEYGAGPVLVWDKGHWIPDGDPHAGYEKGHLAFELQGEKLHGHWHLVRTRGDSKRPSWLLIKGKDSSAQPGVSAQVVDVRPQSALSGRTIEAVASDPKRVWHSQPAPKSRARSSRSKERGARRKALPDLSGLAGARQAKLPAFVEPQLATLVDQAPEGDAWVHEIKLDGYRMLLRCENGDAKLLTRHGHDWSARVPGVLAELAKLAVQSALFDGELVVLHEGISSFQRLQNSLSQGRDGDCIYFAFDLLHLGDRDLRALPLVERKQVLAATLQALGMAANARIRLSEHVVGQGQAFFESACKLGVEGSVCKRADAPYVSGRSRSWLKVKCLARQEFVIGGFSEPSGSRSHFGALLLGVHEGGKLKYAGRVGTGFTQRSLAELHAKLAPLQQARPPFANPPRGAEARAVHWVRPALVAEIEFSERTQEGLVRHASFRGLREDKPAREVHDEHALQVKTPKQAKSRSAPRRREHATAALAKPAASGVAKSRPRRSVDGRPAQPALHSVRLTHPDRVLYPEQGITKAQLALYYARVAAAMLPHVACRPLMLVRCPEGQGKECFHQKHPSRALSPAIHRLAIPEKKGAFECMFVDDAEGLVQLVQIGALEIHTWGSRIDRLEYPDQLTFDLDPDVGLPWSRTLQAAHTLRARLSAIGLASFLKTTGGKGLHLVVPIKASTPWDEAKQFCKTIAESVERAEPDKYVTNISKAKRKNKLLIDYLRNARGATAVCAFSTRASSGATVAAPIAWEELNPELRPDQFDIQNVPARVDATAEDPWRGFAEVRPALSRSMLRSVSK